MSNARTVSPEDVIFPNGIEGITDVGADDSDTRFGVEFRIVDPPVIGSIACRGSLVRNGFSNDGLTLRGLLAEHPNVRSDEFQLWQVYPSPENDYPGSVAMPCELSPDSVENAQKVVAGAVNLYLEV